MNDVVGDNTSFSLPVSYRQLLNENSSGVFRYGNNWYSYISGSKINLGLFCY
jgi:hypothetical protein